MNTNKDWNRDTIGRTAIAFTHRQAMMMPKLILFHTFQNARVMHVSTEITVGNYANSHIKLNSCGKIAHHGFVGGHMPHSVTASKMTGLANVRRMLTFHQIRTIIDNPFTTYCILHKYNILSGWLAVKHTT